MSSANPKAGKNPNVWSSWTPTRCRRPRPCPGPTCWSWPPRGWGGSARYGQVQNGKRLSQPEYVEYWNQHVIVSVQIESIKAVESAASLAVPGLDYLAWGPNDLGLDLKRHPEYRFKTTDECTQYVWEQVRDKGIKMGMAIITEPEEREKYLKMGMTMFQETPRP